MKLAIWDEPHNQYVSQMWFAPLERFARNNGIQIKRIDSPIPEKGWTMVCNAGKLTHAIVRHFLDNECKFAAISCNDSARLTANIDSFFWEIPLLFTVSGVQRVNYSKQSVMNPDMSVTTQDIRFLPEDEWTHWQQMRQERRLLPLPYVPWDRLPDVRPPSKKTNAVLFRGGNHFWRFVAYLFALKANVAHYASGFLTADYFREDMVPQFRYCKGCRVERSEMGRLPWSSGQHSCDCTKDLVLDEPLRWNNRSPRAFFSLASMFEQTHGTIDRGAVESALNFQRQSADHHLRAVADAAFFCECKWEFSIPMPQRFWEAASVGTVNLLPRRTNDQAYFPALYDGEHYTTFNDDFAHFQDLTGNTYSIADNAKAVYEEWIRPGEYVTNTNLLRHIFDRIQEACL